MPCVNVGGVKEAVYIPPEFCEILPGQPFMGKLDNRITAKMITAACQSPDINAGLLEAEGPKRLGFQSDTLEKFNISIDPHLTVCPARILDPPFLNYSGAEPVRSTSGDWTAAYKMLQGATVPKWAVMHLFNREVGGREQITPADKGTIINGLMRQMSAIGITYPQPISVKDATPVDLDSRFKELGENGVKLVFIIIGPGSTKDHYAEIKKLGDTARGITTICCVGKSYFKAKSNPRNGESMAANYMRNIALKINIKSGGINSRLKVDGLLQTLLHKDTMIVSVLGIA